MTHYKKIYGSHGNLVDGMNGERERDVKSIFRTNYGLKSMPLSTCTELGLGRILPPIKSVNLPNFNNDHLALAGEPKWASHFAEGWRCDSSEHQIGLSMVLLL